MEKYGVNQLREMFLSFFESKGHLRLPSFSLIPQDDASLLLINSGMAPMKPYFKGEKEPPRHRVCTCQKCIRTGDIENIGKTDRHGTYFEMLGNFSFGDYFKHEAIAWSWEFLTSPEWVGLDPDRLYPSVYLDDDEAWEIWNKEIGIAPERIFRFGKEDNFWEHGAGPCGPCSEIYYDRGEEYGCGKPTCTVGCDCDRYIEVWNNVFSQFDNDGQNHYTELKQKNIDTGMGLERLAVVCQGVQSLFDVDTVMNITHKVSELTGAYYGQSHKNDVSLRVITDHIRSGVFMICDGVLPSNEGRGYVLRRLLRRAARHGKLLGVNEPFLYKVVETVVQENECQYPELREKMPYIVRVIKTEEENFAKTIDAGMRIFSDLLAEHKAKGETTFSGADAFKLYDTYGFPVDLTIEMCADEGMGVDEEGFKQLMEEQRVRARKAREALGDLGWAGLEFGKDMPETVFMGYENASCEAKVLAIVNTLVSMGRQAGAGRIFRHTISYTLITTTIAATVGLVLYIIIAPQSISSDDSSNAINVASISFYDHIISVIPNNTVQPFLAGNVLSILILAFAAGLALAHLPETEQKQIVIKGLHGFQDVVFLLIRWLIKILPIGIVAFAAQLASQLSAGVAIASLGKYVAVIIGGNAIQFFIVLPLFLLAKGLNPLRTFAAMSPALLMALFTKSSAATLPLTMESAENRLKVNNRISRFVLPICTTINMNGCAAFILVTSLFVMQNAGIELSVPTMILWLAISVVSAVGNAGVPMGCYFLTFSLMSGMNVPVAIMGMILPIYTIIDMIETAENVWSDSCVCAAVDKDLSDKL